jgi:hypothetical protein
VNYCVADAGADAPLSAACGGFRAAFGQPRRSFLLPPVGLPAIVAPPPWLSEGGLHAAVRGMALKGLHFSRLPAGWPGGMPPSSVALASKALARCASHESGKSSLLPEYTPALRG